jgi:hypothetical protein
MLLMVCYDYFLIREYLNHHNNQRSLKQESIKFDKITNADFYASYGLL